MKATPLLIQWHNSQSPIYSAHFQPHRKGRLATGGGDNNVRLWKVESSGETRTATYISTLSKHTQAVNVVRWCPTKDDILASAGDDGNVLVWVPAERHDPTPAFGSDALENKETWRVRHMCRSMGSEIYDLAWSPDGLFFITGSMDNVVRIFNAHDGSMVRQIAEHNHYVQGVAWDPLNEYIATQSSDRSVHIYSLKTKDGQFSLTQFNKISKMDLPTWNTGSHTPTPPDFSRRPSDRDGLVAGSPIVSTPGTPSSHHIHSTAAISSMSYAHTHSRRSSHSSSRRSVSPAPSFPLPAVMPSVSPSFHPNVMRHAHIYANETFTSFFRRLTFSPDGSLLFTPAGQYKLSHPAPDQGRLPEEILNTVYIYTRGGLNRPPIAYLPGHKKASIAVKCSPILYNHRSTAPLPTKTITIDTSADDGDGDIPPLPESVILPPKATTSTSRPDSRSAVAPSPGRTDSEPSTVTIADQSLANPLTLSPVFSLPYRMVYAVAAHDTVYVYDTQQRKPLCVVSNLHYSAFTDLAWSPDGDTLLISSSDGFCSTLAFSPDELGTPYVGPVPSLSRPSPSLSVSSALPLPGMTPAQGPSIASLFPTMAPSSRTSTPILPSATVSRHSRPSTPSTTVSTTSSSRGRDSREAAPASPNTPISTYTTDPCPQPPMWVPHQSGHGLASAFIPASATPTIANLPSLAASHSGSSLGGVGQGGSLVPIPPPPGSIVSTTPPLTPRRSAGSVIVPGSRHRTHSASSSISGFNLSTLPAPPLFQSDSTASIAASSTGFLVPPSTNAEPVAGASRATESVISSRKRGSEAMTTPSDPVKSDTSNRPTDESGSDKGPAKKRRVAPTLVKEADSSTD